jgi:hypothetical protein
VELSTLGAGSVVRVPIALVHILTYYLGWLDYNLRDQQAGGGTITLLRYETHSKNAMLCCEEILVPSSSRLEISVAVVGSHRCSALVV